MGKIMKKIEKVKIVNHFNTKINSQNKKSDDLQWIARHPQNISNEFSLI